MLKLLSLLLSFFVLFSKPVFAQDFNYTLNLNGYTANFSVENILEAIANPQEEPPPDFHTQIVFNGCSYLFPNSGPLTHYQWNFHYLDNDREFLSPPYAISTTSGSFQLFGGTGDHIVNSVSIQFSSNDQVTEYGNLTDNCAWAYLIRNDFPVPSVTSDTPTPDDFVILGSEGVWLKQNVIVHSGDVGASSISNGPFLDSGVETSIGSGVLITDSGSDVFGDSIKLKDNSQVQDAFYNDLSGLGTILGTQTSPLAFPLVPSFPVVPSFFVGTNDVTVAANGTQTLNPGSYQNLLVNHDATLTLSGGTYDFDSWDIRDDAKIYIADQSEIRIAGKLNTNIRAQIVPESSSNIDASDIKIFVTGINGNNGNLGATPKAAEFGSSNQIEANVYVPNGTLWIKNNSMAVGAFLGKWVIGGDGSEFTYESAF